MNPMEFNRAIYSLECKIAQMETKLNNIQRLIYELLEKVEAIGVKGGFNNEFRAKYGLPPMKESEENHENT